MFTVIISVVFGVCGWMIAKLLFEPVKEILDLRREAQECLIVYGNLSKDAPPDERRMAAESFRRVGVGLVSRYNAGYPWVTWCVRRFWDINSAGAFLIGVGRSTQFEGFSHANASPTVPLIRDCLRLPPLEQPLMIRALTEDAGRRPLLRMMMRRWLKISNFCLRCSHDLTLRRVAT
jgi:hypothetical protein